MKARMITLCCYSGYKVITSNIHIENEKQAKLFGFGLKS